MFLLSVAAGEVDDLTEGAGDDAAWLLSLGCAHHGVGLAAAGLPIREDGAIVAFDDAVDEREGSLLVDIALCGVGAEYVVEGEWLGHFFATLLE